MSKTTGNTKNSSSMKKQESAATRERSLLAEIQARNAAAALTYPITDLWICSVIHASGGELERAELGLRLLPFPENPKNLSKDVWTPLSDARWRGLIRKKGHYTNSPFVLTDAGRHLVMTFKTGATARAILSEIEESE